VTDTEEIFHAAYDLERNPPSYDVVAFLSLLDLKRSQRGSDRVHLHIIPGTGPGGFRNDGLSLWPHSLEGREALLRNVCIPLCHLLPSISSIQRYVSRNRLPRIHWGLGERLVSLAEHLKALRAGSRPLRANSTATTDQTIAKNQNLITITLRESEHHPLRNSRVEEWVKAAYKMQELGMRVVVVRDTLKASEPLYSLATDPWPARNIRSRAWLYASARLNMGVSNGPMWMALAMNAPLAMLRPVTEEAGGCYDSEFFRIAGLPKGEQPPGSPAHQRFFWEDDTYDNIMAAFDYMVSS
jgi:hypothetical protein